MTNDPQFTQSGDPDDAHGLYRHFGFTEPKNPQLLMGRHDPDGYQAPLER
jgi:hypothetical protein